MIANRNGRLFYYTKRRPGIFANLNEMAHECYYSVTDIANKLNISTRQLERDFKKCVHSTPKYWLRQQRMIKAKQLFQEGFPPIEISELLGFADYSAFYHEVRHYHNLSPNNLFAKIRETLSQGS